MYIPITIAVLALLMATMFLPRIFWTRIPRRLQSLLIRGAIAMLALHTFFVLTKWGTISSYLNVVISWLAIASYIFLTLLFSRISPRWLTSLSAAILLAPLFASSIVIPLTAIFRPGSIPSIPIGNRLYYKVAQWGNNGTDNSGVDVDIYYRPPFAPFLSRRVQSQPFNVRECNVFTASAISGPTPKTVIARCPNWPTQQAGTVDKLLRLH
jgi:hypothetical protein